MKKITSILALFLILLGMNVQAADFTPQSGEKYLIRNVKKNAYAKYNDSSLKGEKDPTVVLSYDGACDANAVFTISGNPTSGFTIQTSGNQYVYALNTDDANSNVCVKAQNADDCLWKIVENGGKWNIIPFAGSYGWNCRGDYNGILQIGQWKANNTDDNRWEIVTFKEELGLTVASGTSKVVSLEGCHCQKPSFASALEKYKTLNPSTDEEWYDAINDARSVVNGYDSYPTIISEGVNFYLKNRKEQTYIVAASPSLLTKRDETTVNSQWQFIAQPTEGEYKLYNEASKLYVGPMVDLYQATAAVDNIENAGVYKLNQFILDGKEYITLRGSNIGAGDGKSCLHSSNGGVVRWDATDEGSQWALFDAQGIDEEIARLAKYVKTLNELSNSAVYNIVVPEANRGTWAYQPSYSCVENNIDYSGNDMLISTNVSNAGTIDELNKQFAILTSASGKYYLYNIAAKKFVSGVRNVGDGKGSTYLTETPVSDIQLINGKQSDKEFPFVIKVNNESFGVSNAYLNAGGLIFGYNNDEDQGNNAQIIKVKDVVFADRTLVEEAIAKFEAEQNQVVLTRVVGDKFTNRPIGYDYACTFSSTVAKSLPEGVKAYYVAAVDAQSASLTEITDVVPAKTGVVLLANKANVELVESAEKGNTVKDNCLSAVPFAQRMNNSYVLSYDANVMQFYAAKKGSILNPGKAFLQLPAEVQANALVLNFGGETTGIDVVETENAEAPIYDLSGRRVNNTVKGGLYIQNGKKFIIK